MSTTIVYQELQCIESSSSTTLNLKLYTPKINTCSQSFNPTSFEDYYSSKSSSSNSTTSSSCSWSEIEELSNKKDEKKEAIYVQPLLKKSCFKLSEKSLQICTESLGNETGSCAMDSSFFLPPLLSSSSTSAKKMETKKKALCLLRDEAKFPPPLTTLSGSNPIHVRRHCEKGRLVIEAVPSPPIRSSYMQAERSNGRLKLSLVKDYINYDEVYSSCDEQEDNDVCHSQTNENNNNNNMEGDVVKQGLGRKINIIGDYDTNLLENKKSIKDITLEFGVNLGLEKLQRLRRCKEGSQGSKRLNNWEPFWVVT